MDDAILKKLKFRAGMTALVLHAPQDYPALEAPGDAAADFVHLFVTSRDEFAERFATAADAVKENGLLWVSYPKARGKQKYDINRDSLWHLALDAGWHPVAQAALDDNWSAVRMKRNEAGKVYEKPGNIKAR